MLNLDFTYFTNSRTKIGLRESHIIETGVNDYKKTKSFERRSKQIFIFIAAVSYTKILTRVKMWFKFLIFVLFAKLNK